MQASIFLVNDARYVQKNCHKEFLKSYTTSFLTRVKELIGRNVDDETPLDILKVKEAISLLINQEDVATGKNGFDLYFSRFIK